LARAAAAAAFGFLPPFLPFAPAGYAAGVSSTAAVPAPASAAYLAANSALAFSLSFFFWFFDNGAPPGLVTPASRSASIFPSIFICIWLFM